MNRGEALAVLGLPEDATQTQIISAHMARRQQLGVLPGIPKPPTDLGTAQELARIDVALSVLLGTGNPLVGYPPGATQPSGQRVWREPRQQTGEPQDGVARRSTHRRRANRAGLWAGGVTGALVAVYAAAQSLNASSPYLVLDVILAFAITAVSWGGIAWVGTYVTSRLMGGPTDARARTGSTLTPQSFAPPHPQSVPPGPAAAAPEPALPSGAGALELIARLAELRDRGAITDEQYAAKRTELLRRI